MSVHLLLLWIAVIVFVIDALGSRVRFRSPVGLLAIGLALFALSFIL